jgi:MerR family transcriptional regulator, light-induced transcriptional regulator
MAAGLNIAALARRTGVAPDTLRKWEQRYQILAPSRTAGGQRRYSERDVARVEWLRERLGEGYRIGEAASLLGPVGVAPSHSARDHLRAILESLDCGEAADVGLRVDQALALVGIDRTLSEILCPLLVSCDTLSIADEHLVSEAVRSRLGYLLGDTGGGLRGVAVLACAPGERHELGVMMAAIALRRDGWKVVYLGADTPLEASFGLARGLSARILGLSVALAERAEALAHARPPDGVKLVLGGAGTSRALASRFGAVHAGPDLHGAVEALRPFSA